MIPGLGDFHFLRPWWLLAAAPAAWLAWSMLRSQNPFLRNQAFIKPHLLRHLVVAPPREKGIQPTWALIALWALLIFAIAGPSWRLDPSPFADEQAGLMIVMGLNETMEGKDLAPSRLERSRHKVRDLMALRDGAATGLVAYAGGAHLVMPLTTDGRIIEQMTDALSPEIMPTKGRNLPDALTLAQSQIERSGMGGSILVIADGAGNAEVPALEKFRAGGGSRVQILSMTRTREAAAAAGVDKAADALGADWQIATIDDADVKRIQSRADSQIAYVAGERETMNWRDGGYLLVPVIVLLLLLWSRRGWNVSWD